MVAFLAAGSLLHPMQQRTCCLLVRDSSMAFDSRLPLQLQAARGVSTAAPSRQADDEVPGFELRTGPPGSVCLACAGAFKKLVGALVFVHSRMACALVKVIIVAVCAHLLVTSG